MCVVRGIYWWWVNIVTGNALFSRVSEAICTKAVNIYWTVGLGLSFPTAPYVVSFRFDVHKMDFFTYLNNRTQRIRQQMLYRRYSHL